MPDVFTTEKRSAVMAVIRSKDTKPEMAIRRALHAAGFRFRLHVRTLPGKPDIVLPRYKTAIQVRGCFWHGHSCHDGHIPKSRADYWPAKLMKNTERDRANDERLKQMGWNLLVIWECDCSSSQRLELTMSRITTMLGGKQGV